MSMCKETATMTTMTGAGFCGRPSFGTESFKKAYSSIVEFAADGAAALSALFVVLVPVLGALLLGRVLCLLILVVGVILSLLVRIIEKKREASRMVQRCTGRE